ncbi:choline kinase family protein [Roseibium marinum]|uniref:Thiamine kinase n=1 Tax=Roseibium marinum TaxID=281252 RepID=A0A2S3UPV2_9HYPH|nr:choline kinase family protein [Roseibium marinum]POF29731.1 thiamine kinase [Roseibium marinum]
MSADILKAFERHPDLLEICGAPGRAVPQAGLTNRVYRLEAERGLFFLRLPRPENAGLIDRQAEARNLGLAAELGLALPPLYVHPGEGILVTGAVDVMDCAPEDFPSRLGDTLGRLHGSGAEFAGVLDPDDVYRAQRDFLASAAELRPEIAPLDQALRELANRPADAGAIRRVPVHGDLSPGNCLWTPDRLWLIDWEYSAMADPAWDLAYAILEHGFSEVQESAFLAAYKAKQPTSLVPAGDRLEAMKARCDAVSALWALEQVARGRDAGIFLPFARGRRDRALARVRVLI